MLHFASYTSVYEQLSSGDCSLFSHNISLTDILSQATYRTWWKHIDPICPTFSCFPYSSLFPFHWQSSTPVQPVSLTSVLAKSIQEHLVWHLQPGALGFPKPWGHCLALHRIHPLPERHLCSRLDYLYHRTSLANFLRRECYLVCDPHHFGLDDCQFFGFCGHLIFEFVIECSPLHTNLVAKVIFLTI